MTICFAHNINFTDMCTREQFQISSFYRDSSCLCWSLFVTRKSVGTAVISSLLPMIKLRQFAFSLMTSPVFCMSFFSWPVSMVFYHRLSVCSYCWGWLYSYSRILSGILKVMIILLLVHVTGVYMSDPYFEARSGGVRILKLAVLEKVLQSVKVEHLCRDPGWQDC